MKKILIGVLLLIAAATAGYYFLGDISMPVEAKKPADSCALIKDGVIEYSSTEDVIPMGYDDWGYNYQAHMFNGLYDNYSRPDDVVTEGDVRLMMKWSDTWLSNKDCNGDGKLDRGYACDPVNASSSGCPGAWLTNHEQGSYVDPLTEEICEYTYFVKIITPDPASGAEVIDGYWYTEDGEKIGEMIWGAYAIVQEVSNDPCGGEHGLLFKSEYSPGLGFYNP